MASTISGAQAVGIFVVVVLIIAAVIYLPALIAPPREGPLSESFGGPDPGVRAAPRVLPPDIALPTAGSQNWCGAAITPQRESRTASGPIHEIALEFSDDW